MVPIEQVYRQIAELAQAAGVGRGTLFGSRGRGTNLPKSDIDLAVEGCPDFPGFEETLQEDLWSLLQVDVVNLDGPASQELRDAVARDGRVLYEEV